MPYFSVLIPAYNAAQTVAETLQSLAKQSFVDFEVIVVNDGSTDATEAIINHEASAFKAFRVIAQTNHGLGHARNAAAKQASSTWLVFLDADDVWAPNKLQVLHDAIASNPAAEFVYHPIFEKYPNGHLRKRKFSPVKNLDDFVRKGNPFVPSAVAIKKEIYLAAGGFVEDRTQVEDLYLWFKLLAEKCVLLALHQPLTVYRVGAGVTANLAEHLQKVEHACRAAQTLGHITQHQAETFLQHKNYEAARQLHKLGKFDEALGFYNRIAQPLIKTKVLWFLAKKGIVA
jgi:glycosyltransferase involved in cell wall biosynthesis